MPFGTSYTTDPGPREQMHASTAGSTEVTPLGRYRTTDETLSAFNDMLSSGASTDKYWTETFDDPWQGGSHTTVGTQQSYIFQNKTSSGTTYLFTSLWTNPYTTGSFSRSDTGTTSTKTVPPLTVVETVLSSSATPGAWTGTETYEDTVYSTTGTTLPAELTTVTRTGTTITNATTRPQSYSFITTRTVTTVDPVTARTFRITYPDYGGFLFVPVTSSAHFTALDPSVLQTTASWTDPVSVSSVVHTEFAATSTYSYISAAAVTSMFSSTTWGGSSQITQQYWETVLRQYSTRTAAAFGVNSGTQHFQVTLSSSTQASFFVLTNLTSYSARRTSERTVSGSVITGTQTTISNIGWTTREVPLPLYGISTLSYPVSDTKFDTPVFQFAPLAGTVTRTISLAPFLFAGVAVTHGSTNGFAPVPGSAATPAGLDMSPATAWGMGLTGIPSTWTSAGLAFAYSTVNNEGHPVLVPISGKEYTRFGTPVRTVYHGSVGTDGATISRTLEDTTASTSTTDQTSFVWQTLAALSSTYTFARNIHYHAPATHYHGNLALIEIPGTTYKTTGANSIVAGTGQSIRLTPLPHLTASGRFGLPPPITTNP